MLEHIRETGNTLSKGLPEIVRPGANGEEKFRSRRTKIVIERKITKTLVTFDPDLVPLLSRTAWQRVCETWAEIQNENLLTIRYQPDLWPGMRCSFGDRQSEILGVIDQPARPGKRKITELHVQEIYRTSAVLPGV